MEAGEAKSLALVYSKRDGTTGIQLVSVRPASAAQSVVLFSTWGGNPIRLQTHFVDLASPKPRDKP